MNIIEISKRIDKSQKNMSYVDTITLGEELGIPYPDWVHQERLMSYWVTNWLCTDTSVGTRIYFLDDIPVAFSQQSGRKSNEHFQWFSRTLAIQVRDYLLSIMPEDDLDLTYIDMNKDFGEEYLIHYNSQLMGKSEALYNGEEVEIISKINNLSYGADNRVVVKKSDETEKEVYITELRFPIHLKEER